jgi:hypothetical protein
MSVLTAGGGIPGDGTTRAVGGTHDGDSVVKKFMLAYSIVVMMSATDLTLASDLPFRSDPVQERLGASIGKNTRQRHAPGSNGNAAPVFRLSSKSSISLPAPQLLERPAAPNCQFKSAAHADDDVALRTIMKLDYEQQCYRQSESILRARMEQLQDAVSKTIGSLK